MIQTNIPEYREAWDAEEDDNNDTHFLPTIVRGSFIFT
jgi:hypothetical protein